MLMLEEASKKNPLGILCRHEEYKSIIKNFVHFTVGTQNRVIPICDIEPFASAPIYWIKHHTGVGREFMKPVLAQIEQEKIDPNDLKKRWIPVLPDLISPKELRPNLSYLRTAARNTQSVESSTLTNMLPHRGRAVRQKDLIWGSEYYVPPVEMTDKPETHFGTVKGCFSVWAEKYTHIIGCSPY